MEKNLYARNEPISSETKRIMFEIAYIGWVSHGHSAGFVPVCAIGAGTEKFSACTDNAQIPLKIAEAAGYKCR